jgi:two-component system OmpR family response regulator
MPTATAFRSQCMVQAEEHVRILVVEDDPEMGLLLTGWLGQQGMESEWAQNGVDGLIAFGNGQFSAAAIDVMLPGMSGFEVCRRLREADSQLPIVLLTARDAIEDRVYGLDAGADDYITKPFDFAELGARMRALFRRDAAGTRATTRVGGLVLDSLTTQVAVGDRRTTLSIKEFAVLRMLATSVGVPVSRIDLLTEVWGARDFIHPNIVEQYVSFIRRKIDLEAAGVRIRTIRGTGYVLEQL